MTISINNNSLSALMLTGIAGYIGIKLAKQFNLQEVWERNIPFSSMEEYNKLISQSNVTGYSFTASNLTGASIDILRRVPVMNETIVATVGAIFGAAIGFGVAKLTNL